MHTFQTFIEIYPNKPSIDKIKTWVMNFLRNLRVVLGYKDSFNRQVNNLNLNQQTGNLKFYEIAQKINKFFSEWSAPG